MVTRRLTLLAALCSMAACIETLPIEEGGTCPCAEGFVCCPATDTCHSTCTLPPDGGPDTGTPDSGPTAEPDAGMRDSGSGDAAFDAGFYDGGVARVLAEPPESIGPWTWSNNRGTTHRSDGFTTTWVGDELLMFGGQVSGCAPYHDRYNPWTDQWRRFNVGIQSRGEHSAHWTGDRLLVWGGNVCGLADDTFVDGAYYDPLFHRTDPIADAPGAAAFHSSVMVGDRLFVYGGGCFSATCLDRGVLYEPLLDQWRFVSNEGAPEPFEGVRNAEWTGNEVLMWGGAESSGRYHPSVDVWESFPAPDFTVGVGVSVWTDDEFIVWDGAVGGRFDPRTNVWTRTSTVGAPKGLVGAQAVWTGVEMIVMGQGGGAHYDPDTDRWSPVTTSDAYFAPANSRITWTGREILVFGSALPTGTHGARYGPRITGDPGCDGGAPPLSVRINTPTARTVVEGEVDLRAAIINEFSVQRVEWSFDGTIVGTSQTLLYDITTHARGAHNVQVEVEDAMGNTTCASRTLFVDRAPTVTVTAPANDVVATPTVRASASCEDDGPEGCMIRVLVDDVVVRASTVGVGRFDREIDLSAFEGRFVDLTFEARDAVGQRVTESRFVYVESSVRLVPHAEVIGTTCDVTPSRALFDDGAGNFVVFHVATSSTVVTERTGVLDCTASRLVEPSGAFLKAGAVVHDMTDGSIRTTFTAGGMRVAGGWVVYTVGPSLERRRPSVGLRETVGANPYPGEAFDIATNGDVVWQERTTGDLFAVPAGGTSVVLSNLPAAPPIPSPLATSSWIVWRTPGSPNTAWSIDGYDGSSPHVLTGPNVYSVQGPRRERDYFAAGGYVAFDAPDVQQISQVWLTAPDGTRSIVTGFTSDTHIVALDESGDLVYSREGRFVHRDRETTITTEFGSDLGTVRARAGAWFVQYGRTIYRLNL